MKKAALLAIIALLPGAFLMGCAKPGGGPRPEPAERAEAVKIGAYLPLTGNTAVFGQSTKNGLNLALKTINASGGVLGRPLELVIEDDAGKANQVQGVVKKLINRDQVLVIIGEVTSSCTLEGAPLCQEAGVPMITPAATNPEVTKKGDYIFRVCFIDTFQGAVCAEFAAKNLKAARVAILKDTRSAYSKGLADAFREHFEKLGGKIVAEESYSEGDTDFGAQLITIKAANPQVIFIPGYYNDVGLIALKARELGITCDLLGGDGWDGPPLVEIGGKAIEGGYFSSHYSADDPRPEVQRFVEAYKKEYGTAPDAMAALAYDALSVMAAAISQAGKLDRTAIREQLAAARDFPGVTGSISIDGERNCIKPAVILQVSGGKWKYVTSIQP